MASVSLLSTGIDRKSEVPYYLQLARMVVHAIDAGEYHAGERLPGESALCERHGLARSTVREMLRHLSEQGRVRLVPRRGAFVAAPAESGWHLQVTQGFLEVEAGLHRQVETRVLEATPARLSDAAAAALDLPLGSTGLRLVRVRRLDGALAMYSVNWLPPFLAEALRDTEVLSGGGSLSRALRALGHATHRARRSVVAVVAPHDVAQALALPSGHPVLGITSTSWDRQQRPFDYYTSWVRSDVVRVTVDAQAVV